MILVTGGTGLVGAHLLLELCKGEVPITATYRNIEKLKQVEKIFGYQTATPKKLLEKIAWIQADILDIPALEEAFHNVEQVYHTAAMVSFDPREEKNILTTNIKGTTNVVNFCIKKSVKKLCFISSIGALSPSIKGEVVTEGNEWTTGSTTYGISKHFAEMEVWRASQEGVEVVIVNPGVIIAPGFWKSSSGSFFHYAAKGPKYHLPSGTGFVGVNDVVQVMTKLMNSNIHKERYILVNQNWSYHTFAKLLAKGLDQSAPQIEIQPWHLQLFWRLDWLRSALLGKRRTLSRAVAKLFKTTETYDNSKIKKELNYSFENLEERVAEYCAIYLNEKRS